MLIVFLAFFLLFLYAYMLVLIALWLNEFITEGKKNSQKKLEVKS